MSAAQHTPGPWYVDSRVAGVSNSFYIRGSEWGGLPMTHGKGAVAHIPRSRVLPSAANARLIAAAPELLEALQKFEAWSKAESNHEGTTFWGRVEMLRELDACARAAIAKAIGQVEQGGA